MAEPLDVWHLGSRCSPWPRLGLALWNGRDPILKERPFGLTGPQGNHGECVREYWSCLDATPTHSWNRWRYHYPQCAYPCQDLVAQNAARNRLQPEYELIDTGAFDSGRYGLPRSITPRQSRMTS